MKKRTLGISVLYSIFSVVVVLSAAAGQLGEPKPPDDVVQQGIPPVPKTTMKEYYPFADYDTYGLLGWDIGELEPLVTRYADSGVQVARLTKPQGAPEFFTHLPDGHGELYPDPRGKYLVYSQAADGNYQSQLYRYDIATNTSTLLTDGRSRNLYPVWSNSGSLMSYSSTRRNGKDMDVYLMDPLDPKTDRLLAKLEGEDWAVFDWSPDDRSIILSDYKSPYETYLWVLDIKSGLKTLAMPNRPGQKSFNGSWAYFSKDSKGIYFYTDLGSDFRRLAYLDLTSKKFRILTPNINWDVDEIALSPDGRSLAFVTNEGGAGRLRVFETFGHRESVVSGLPVGIASGLKWNSSSDHLGFVFASHKSPPGVFSLNVKTGKVEEWAVSRLKVKIDSLPEPELVKWKSFDGLTISGWINRPASGSGAKHPVIIDIHAGAYDEFRPQYNPEDAYLTGSLGVAIVHPNVRGSSGHGKVFMSLSRGALREHEVDDIGALLDWISHQPDLDSSRVLVSGSSYGGYLALSTAEKYPTRISAVLGYVSVTNLVTFVERSANIEPDAWRREFGDERDPKTRELLERLAPLNNASKIVQPIFLAIGGKDQLCSQQETEEIISNVRSRGIPGWYLLAKSESHGFGNAKSFEYFLRSKMLFIKTFLLGGNR